MELDFFFFFLKYIPQGLFNDQPINPYTHYRLYWPCSVVVTQHNIILAQPFL